MITLILKIIAVIIGAYIIGSIPTGYIIVKALKGTAIIFKINVIISFLLFLWQKFL